jgi:endonuclease YncB( thermonuclease family)
MPLSYRDGDKGLLARDELQALVSKQVVECEWLYFGRYDRVVAICRVDGRDLGENMLAVGLAVLRRRGC